MTRTRRIVGIALTAALAACGEAEPPTAALPPLPPNPDPSLAGTFYASFNGLDDDVALAATLQLALAESSGVLVGTFGIEGILYEGQDRLEVAGTGTLEGTVAGTDLAPLSFTARSDLCAGHTADFSGLYNRLTGVLGVEGNVNILDQLCTVVYTYPISVAMRR